MVRAVYKFGMAIFGILILNMFFLLMFDTESQGESEYNRS